MDARDAVLNDREAFDNELRDLIRSAARSGSSSSSRKRSAVLYSSPEPKRPKSGHSPEEDYPSEGDYDLHVHPSRLTLLQQSRTFEKASPSYGRVQHDPTLPRELNEDLGNIKNSEPSIGCSGQKKTWPTLTNTIKRQWDFRKDDLDYEGLLERRRNERLHNVDRYVPQSTSKTNKSYFPLDRLPQDIKKKVFSMLLVKHDGPITIDFHWLRPFVKGHARIPNLIHKIQHNGRPYVLPVEWDQLISDVKLLETDMLEFGHALEFAGVKRKKTRSPTFGLSSALLRVSRNIHRSATEVFYCENTFSFPCATSSWIQLDTFLATIGPENAAKLQNLRIHAPMWHRGVREDFVEGKMLDLMSPATRMAVIHSPARDRLLSAIRHSVHTLLNSNLVSLSLELENALAADYWTNRHINDRRMVSMSDAEEYVQRKVDGIVLLNRLSDKLAINDRRPLFEPFPAVQGRAS